MVNYPEDWKTYNFDDYFAILNNNTYPRAMESATGQISNIHYGDVLIKYGENLNNVNDVPKLSSALDTSAFELLRNGDVVFADTAEDDTVGKCIQIGDFKGKLISGLHTIPCRPKIETASGFLGYYLNSRLFHDQLLPYITGIKVSSISKTDIKNTEITIPPLPEQREIAKVLSSFNEHLANLDELITKKKAIRDGALEELVSGKKRLQGFDGEWGHLSFEKTVTPKARIGWQNLRTDEYLSVGYSYIFEGTDFSNGTIDLSACNFVTKERYAMDQFIQVSKGDVLVTKDGTIGKVAVVPKIDKPATLNSGVYVFRPNGQLTKQFLYWILRSSIFDRFIEDLSAGSTIKHLYQKDLKNFYFDAPKHVEEQQAIADALSSMDAEILALEEEREKIEKIKLGAMDDLLTGRVRLNAEV